MASVVKGKINAMKGRGTCSWRENGGTCDKCVIMKEYINDISDECPFLVNKNTYKAWTQKQQDKIRRGKIDPATSCV